MSVHVQITPKLCLLQLSHKTSILLRYICIIYIYINRNLSLHVQCNISRDFHVPRIFYLAISLIPFLVIFGGAIFCFTCLFELCFIIFSAVEGTCISCTHSVTLWICYYIKEVTCLNVMVNAFFITKSDMKPMMFLFLCHFWVIWIFLLYSWLFKAFLMLYGIFKAL